MGWEAVEVKMELREILDERSFTAQKNAAVSEDAPGKSVIESLFIVRECCNHYRFQPKLL